VESAPGLSGKRFVVEIYCILEGRLTTGEKARPNGPASRTTLYFLVSLAFPPS